jgi:5'-nucleotidase
MNIFLTNDDGVDSEGIQKLAVALRATGKHRVGVLAPDTNRSGISNAVSLLNDPVKLLDRGHDTWSCSGYPADCVIAALLGALPFKPEIVLSGINRGENLGTDLVYSGTAAAARQASFAGIPAVALSLAGKGVLHWDMAAAWVAGHLEELTAFWREDCFVNVNIPNSPGGPVGMLEAWPAIKTYTDKLTVTNAPDGSRWCFLQGEPVLTAGQADSDCDVVARNYVSVTSVYSYPVAQKRQT